MANPGTPSVPSSNWASVSSPVNARTDLKYKSYSVTTTVDGDAVATGELDPGVYNIFLGGMPSDVVVFLRTSSSDAPPAVPTPSPSGESSAGFPACFVERVGVTKERPYLHVKTVGGVGTLYLIPVA